MDKIQHPSNNAVLGAPAGWDQEKLPCGALPITRADIGGQAAVLSYWKPTPGELAQLVAGAPIVLWVLGETMPPVSLTVDA